MTTIKEMEAGLARAKSTWAKEAEADLTRVAKENQERSADDWMTIYFQRYGNVWCEKSFANALADIERIKAWIAEGRSIEQQMIKEVASNA
jgi:hypothetical protein